jgi:hypothetical protein
VNGDRFLSPASNRRRPAAPGQTGAARCRAGRRLRGASGHGTSPPVLMSHARRSAVPFSCVNRMVRLTAARPGAARLARPDGADHLWVQGLVHPVVAMRALPAAGRAAAGLAAGLTCLAVQDHGREDANPATEPRPRRTDRPSRVRVAGARGRRGRPLGQHGAGLEGGRAGRDLGGAAGRDLWRASGQLRGRDAVAGMDLWLPLVLPAACQGLQGRGDGRGDVSPAVEDGPVERG